MEKRKFTAKTQKQRLGFYSKKNDNIATPKELYDLLNAEFNFDFDPCPLNGEEKFNGLLTDWKKCNFVNPPFSAIEKWIQKGRLEMEKGNKTVFLITARTHAHYWHDLVWPVASEIRFLMRGVVFEGFTNCFPSPLAIVIFDPERKGAIELVPGRYPYAVFKSSKSEIPKVEINKNERKNGEN